MALVHFTRHIRVSVRPPTGCRGGLFSVLPCPATNVTKSVSDIAGATDAGLLLPIHQPLPPFGRYMQYQIILLGEEERAQDPEV